MISVIILVGIPSSGDSVQWGFCPVGIPGTYRMISLSSPRFSNQSDNVGYSTFASQVSRFTRIYNHDNVIFNLFVSLGFDSFKLIKTFTNCINRHNFIEMLNTIGHTFFPISI